ncbi:hypothetical protein QBC44DRAFT_248817 [Cladorrhinum sp. PSN332]|nr:hypothetical protein QBC44DRAFT_248817 [Cladorrhinum sp. PSN332]
MEDLFGAPYTNQTVVWQREPDSRGTFTLLITSIITLVLCVWTSIHLNLPDPRESKWTGFRRRLKWITIGLFIPELLVSTAIEQYRLARRISKEAEKVFGGNQDEEQQRPKRRHPWTLTHSYWAIMGGIAVDGSNANTKILPRGVMGLFTPSGVSMLLRHEPELIPDVSEKEINDKSKGGSWAKFIACAQASWFCIACAGRVSQRLPLSQLELSTFAHALCTVAVYIMWWKKPLDVEIPIFVTEERVRPLLAYCWMASAASARRGLSTKGAKYRVSGNPEFEAISLSSNTASSNGLPGSMSGTKVQIYSESPPRTVGTVTVTGTDCLSGTGFYVNDSSTHWKVEVLREASSGTWGGSRRTYVADVMCFEPVLRLSSVDAERWRHASAALAQYQLERPDNDLDLISVKTIPETTSSTAGLAEAIKDWSGFILASTIYGAVHLMAWDSLFPKGRALVWRYSSIIIIGPSCAAAILVLLMTFTIGIRHLWLRAAGIFPPLPRSWPKSQGVVIRLPRQALRKTKAIGIPVLRCIWAVAKVLGLLCVALTVSYGAMLYIASRAYIIFESFRTVFSQPPEVYKVVEWSQYLPHIT